jgi:HAD superfamily hydrolase (TIGR01549 family)
LEFYKDKNLFVASGSNEEELKEIFKIREINKYFISIYGSPKKKSDIVKEIVKKYPNSIMIGDANSDMNAAKEVKIDFIFMRDYSTNEELKKRDDLVIINNLGDVI